MPSSTMQPASRWWVFLLICTLYIAAERPRAEPINVIGIPDAVFCHYDKIAHMGVYGLMAIALYRTPGFLSRGSRGRILALLVTMALGFGDEAHQYLYRIRMFEWGDVASDWIGAFLAIQFIKVRWIERILCTPILIRLRPWRKTKPSEYPIELGQPCASKTWLL